MYDEVIFYKRLAYRALSDRLQGDGIDSSGTMPILGQGPSLHSRELPDYLPDISLPPVHNQDVNSAFQICRPKHTLYFIIKTSRAITLFHHTFPLTAKPGQQLAVY